MDKTNALQADIATALARIQALLPYAMLQDSARAKQNLGQLRLKIEAKTPMAGLRFSPRVIRQLEALEKRLSQSARERSERFRQRPALRFPSTLPITSRRREIVQAIIAHPVVIIAGETGCGKSTQLPKMCLEAGRGVAGKIGCTQPRRIAAITIAHRIAEELGEPLGQSVGYKIRFQNKTSPQAYIKIMTDGMLLAEAQSDRRLYEYDTLIIDEAHERSLNIDFLLGILRVLLTVRPELKVLITSATLDTEKFSRAFNGAPVIEVSGRTYPVEVEYMPVEYFGPSADRDDYIDLAVRAVDELKSRKGHGDILIFMPTEQDILETCAKLEGKSDGATSVLPLYARLPASHQGRVYSVTGPKIVVATNVAETSLTIPRIRYVIDTGLTRISQYQPGSRINSLPISPISQASADQRKGRCGRVREGLCIRLYSEEDYQNRPAFTPPEVLRSNLAEVILRMLYLKLGHPADFPFVDRPHPRAIKDGFAALIELQAITGLGRDGGLTELGRQMAGMPLDPRISRMLLEAAAQDCLPEVAVIAGALSIRDPRERPPEKSRLADQVQATFVHPESDFLTYLYLWNRFQSYGASPSSWNEKKKFCHDHFLSFPRMREWVFVHEQILAILEEQKIPLGRSRETQISADLYARIHKAILSGFLSHIAARKEKNIYRAAKGGEVIIFPGSALFNKSRPWIVAAEMVRTSRLYARTVARIELDWVEEVVRGLCRYSYSDPYWDEQRGEVRAKEKVSLFNLELVSDRDVAYGPKNPEEAHRIFVRQALVEGRIKNPPAFLLQNLALQERVRSMEEKLRRRDIMVDEETIADFYSSRLAGVYDRVGLQKRLEQLDDENFLKLTEKDLLLSFPPEEELADYPDELTFGSRSFRLTYRFAPGDPEDGATLEIPFSELGIIPKEELDWAVPGYLQEKITALIKGLPKAYRKQLQPFQETTDTIIKEMRRTDEPFLSTLAKFVQKKFGVDVPDAEWAKVEVPPHLRLRIAVLDEQGRPVAASRNLDLLRRKRPVSLAPEDSPEWKKAQIEWEREDIRDWNFGPLPESILVRPFEAAYPGLIRQEKGVGLRLFRTREEALASHVQAVGALLEAKYGRDLDFLRRYLVVFEEYEKATLFFGGPAEIEKGMLENIRREIFQKNIRNREEFEAYAETVLGRLFEKSHLLRQATFAILSQYQKTQSAIGVLESGLRAGSGLSTLVEEVKSHLNTLVPRNFLEVYGLDRLVHLPRFLQAIEVRIERARVDLEKDRRKAEQAKPFLKAWERLNRKLGPSASLEKRAALEQLRWMIEEFRVSLFAPELRTAIPVSAKRLSQKLGEIETLS